MKVICIPTSFKTIIRFYEISMIWCFANTNEDNMGVTFDLKK